MLQPQDRYSELDRDMRSERMRHTLWRGPLIPLASIGVMGEALLALVLGEPFLALFAMAAVFAIGVLYVGTTLPSKQTFVSAVGSLLDKRFPIGEVPDAQAQAALERTKEQFIAVAVRIRSLDNHGPSDPMRRALAAAFGLLATQHEAAARGGPDPGSGGIAGEALRELEAMARLLDVMQDTPPGERAAMELQIARESEAALVRLSTQTDTGEATELQHIQRLLQNGFTRLKEENGLHALRQLTEEYDRLRPGLAQRSATDPTALARAPQDAEATFRLGLTLLQKALPLADHIQPQEIAQRQAVKAGLEKEIAALRENPQESDRLRLKEGELANAQKLLDEIHQNQFRFDWLLHNCGECETSLALLRMRLAAFHADTSEGSVNAVVETLENIMEQARAVQEEMRKLGL